MKEKKIQRKKISSNFPLYYLFFFLNSIKQMSVNFAEDPTAFYQKDYFIDPVVKPVYNLGTIDNTRTPIKVVKAPQHNVSHNVKANKTPVPQKNVQAGFLLQEKRGDVKGSSIKRTFTIRWSFQGTKIINPVKTVVLDKTFFELTGIKKNEVVDFETNSITAIKGVNTVDSHAAHIILDNSPGFNKNIEVGLSKKTFVTLEPTKQLQVFGKCGNTGGVNNKIWSAHSMSSKQGPKLLNFLMNYKNTDGINIFDDDVKEYDRFLKTRGGKPLNPKFPTSGKARLKSLISTANQVNDSTLRKISTGNWMKKHDATKGNSRMLIFSANKYAKPWFKFMRRMPFYLENQRAHYNVVSKDKLVKIPTSIFYKSLELLTDLKTYEGKCSKLSFRLELDGSSVNTQEGGKSKAHGRFYHETIAKQNFDFLPNQVSLTVTVSSTASIRRRGSNQ